MKAKRTIFLSKILIHLCIQLRIIHACLRAFRKTDALKCHIKDCSKINGNQIIKMPEKGEHVKFKSYDKKIKSHL